MHIIKERKWLLYSPLLQDKKLWSAAEEGGEREGHRYNSLSLLFMTMGDLVNV
jgi:hypothetical protein